MFKKENTVLSELIKGAIVIGMLVAGGYIIKFLIINLS